MVFSSSLQHPNPFINNLKLSDYEKENSLYKDQLLSLDKEISYYENKKEFPLNKCNVLQKLNNVILDEFINRIYIGKLDKEKKSRIIKILWNL